LRINQRRFINYNVLSTGKKFVTFTFLKRGHTNYQKKNTKNFLLIAKSPAKIEEPFFNQFLKISKKLTRLNFLLKAKSLNFNKTSKPNGIRMGKGKGKIKHKIGLLKKNQALISVREIVERSLFNLFLVLKGKTSSKLNFSFQQDSY